MCACMFSLMLSVGRELSFSMLRRVSLACLSAMHCACMAKTAEKTLDTHQSGSHAEEACHEAELDNIVTHDSFNKKEKRAVSANLQMPAYALQDLRWETWKIMHTISHHERLSS